MKFFPFLVASVIGFLPLEAKATDQEHRNLIQTLNDNGITVVINPLECLTEEGIDGAYVSSQRLMFICQDNMKTAYNVVDWTPNDLDTLRHETQHVIQDCNDGAVGDSEFQQIFTNTQIAEFAQSLWTEERIEQLIEAYWNNDVPEAEAREYVFQELEAFLVAQSVTPESMAEKVDLVCSN